MEEIEIYNIIWSPSFKKELDNILYYISNVLQEPKIAKKLFLNITTQISKLKYFAEINSNFFIHNIELKKLIIKKYVVIYQINPENKQVYILHIFHGNQNYFNQIWKLFYI